MYFLPEYRNGAQCVFKSLCNHAPAVTLAVHEFVNHPSKPLCAEHAERVKRIMK